MFQHQIRVSFSDCDGLGHVNHAKYFTYMEEARADVFRLFNPNLDLHAWNLIVASARCEFLKQVQYAETLRVLTWVSRIGSASFTVEHAILNEAGDYAARGQGVMIAFDYAANKSQVIEQEIRVKLEEHMSGPIGAPGLR